MNDAMISGVVEWVTRGVEIAGIGVILGGAIFSFVLVARAASRRDPDAYGDVRANLGRSILLGLELLVAADIINTVAIEPTLESLAVLAGIVLIRTFLSFALEVEIEGRWPWQGRRDADRGL